MKHLGELLARGNSAFDVADDHTMSGIIREVAEAHGPAGLKALVLAWASRLTRVTGVASDSCYPGAATIPGAAARFCGLAAEGRYEEASRMLTSPDLSGMEAMLSFAQSAKGIMLLMRLVYPMPAAHVSGDSVPRSRELAASGQFLALADLLAEDPAAVTPQGMLPYLLCWAEEIVHTACLEDGTLAYSSAAVGKGVSFPRGGSHGPHGATRSRAEYFAALSASSFLFLAGASRPDEAENVVLSLPLELLAAFSWAVAGELYTARSGVPSTLVERSDS